MIINESLFWQKVFIKGPEDCWEWQAAIDTKGYGVFSVQRRIQRAHRIAYILFYDEDITSEDVIRHMCDNRPCCNPTHLLKGTKKDNSHDIILRNPNTLLGRKGVANIQVKLSEDEVRSIRERCLGVESQSTIAKDYNVTQSLVSQIHRRTIWSHVV